MHSSRHRTRLRLVASAAIAAVIIGLPTVSSRAQTTEKPPRPVLVTAIGGPDGTATVSWMPGMGGGEPTSHSIHAFDTRYGIASVASACGTCRYATVTGLIGGHMYNFAVYALNAAGASPAGIPSVPALIPQSPPTAPRDVRADARDRKLRVAWVPPANEGAPLTNYSIAAIDFEGKVASTSTACATCTSTYVEGLTNGATYTATVRAHNGQGIGPSETTAPVAPTAVPPQLAAASVTPTSDGFTVDWTVASGPQQQPDRVGVQAFGHDDTFAQWIAPATDNTLTMKFLPHGSSYTLYVIPQNDAGNGPARILHVTTGAGACPGTELCATVATAEDSGPAEKSVQGLLLSYTPRTPDALLQQLDVQQWRINIGGAPHAKAQEIGTSITAILGDSWAWSAKVNGQTMAPWANWSRYAMFVTHWVRHVKAKGQRVDYWDIENEPGYRPFAGPPPTTELWYEMYRVAYNAIKEADPEAKIVAPSFGQFFWTHPNRDAANARDTSTFMRYSAARGLQFDALSWHELGIAKRGYYDTPQRVLDDLQAAATLVRLTPGLGSPKLFVNEYMPPSVRLVPGHVAGVITALERGDADEANQSCYGCGPGTLSSMLLDDERTPRGTYWVHQLYGTMTGERLKTYSSDPAVTVFATSPSPGKFQLMVARHQSCVRALNARCSETAAATPPAAPFSLRLDLGDATGASTTALEVPAGTGALLAPRTAPEVTTSTSEGTAVVSVPSLADGDVYFLTVTLN